MRKSLIFVMLRDIMNNMGKITDISKQKRVKTRVNIYIDGEFACGLDEVTVAAARIKLGDEITAEELKELAGKSEINSAFERAVGYLSAAPRAKREIEKYLRDKGYDVETISAVIEKLVAYRYIDDTAYATSYIRSKLKKYGSFRIKAELRKKGIPDSVIDELLADGEDTEDDGALDVARKYIRSHGEVDVQKLKRFLAGRGYSWDRIARTVDALRSDGVFDSSDDDFYD